MPNEKWLTDVTKFKWYEGTVVHKVYLSAILDLYDRRIVSFIIRDRCSIATEASSIRTGCSITSCEQQK